MLTTFLEIYMKFLHDNKAVKGLQELITKRVGEENSPKGSHMSLCRSWSQKRNHLLA